MLVFALMVTVPLKRSFHFSPSEYVAVQLGLLEGGVEVVGVGVDVGLDVGLDEVGSGEVVVPPAFSALSTLVYAAFLFPELSKSSGVPDERHESLSRTPHTVMPVQRET